MFRDDGTINRTLTKRLNTSAQRQRHLAVHHVEQRLGPGSSHHLLNAVDNAVDIQCLIRSLDLSQLFSQPLMEPGPKLISLAWHSQEDEHNQQRGIITHSNYQKKRICSNFFVGIFLG